MITRQADIPREVMIVEFYIPIYQTEGTNCTGRFQLLTRITRVFFTGRLFNFLNQTEKNRENFVTIIKPMNLLYFAYQNFRRLSICIFKFPFYNSPWRTAAALKSHQICRNKTQKRLNLVILRVLLLFDTKPFTQEWCSHSLNCFTNTNSD